MKTICLVIHSLGLGGMERVMSELVNCFAGYKQTEIHIILIGLKREVVYQLDEMIILHKPPFTFRNSLRTFDTIRTIHYLRKEVRKIDPDMMLRFGEIWNNLVLLSLLRLGYPVYISDRSQPNKDLGFLHNRLWDLLYPGEAGYIIRTGHAAEVCISNGWNKYLKVISNPNWKLVIVGGDEKKIRLSEELKQLVKDLNVEKSVFLEGEINDVESNYNRSTIFAFPPVSEGFPNVIDEAMFAGLPVVTYDCHTGLSDLITDDKNGFLAVLFHNKYSGKNSCSISNIILITLF